ncbi:addiction module protein [Mucilaginibacter gracilis]|nr:addiction module protein [Mucilaginibacter gracilis]
MNKATLKQKLHDYIDIAEEKKLKAIYTILESELEEGKWWNDKETVAELERRTEELRTGKEKGFTWDEIKERVRKSSPANQKA